MGLVILSVFALTFAFVACGDSNTADPYTPPIIDPNQPSNGNGGSGQGQEPPPEVTRAIDRLVVTGQVTRFSKEGQPPQLNGALIDIIYSDGSVVRAANLNDFVTVPAILGEAEINSVSATQALPIAVSIVHRDDPTKSATVMLPGVNALVVSGRGLSVASGGANYTAGWANIHTAATATASGSAGAAFPTKGAAVFGAGIGTGSGVSVAASTRVTGEYFQDAALPSFNYPTVYVKYQGLTDFSKTWLNASATNAAKTGVLPSTDIWETIPLNQNYVFADYDTSFRNISVKGSTNKRYAFGIDDEQQNVYFLISKGRTHGSTPVDADVTGSKTALNSSIYVRIPWDTGNNTPFVFHYIRKVEVDNVDWLTTEPGQTWNFFTQAEALRREAGDWKTDLLRPARNFRLKVYYNDYEEPLIRDLDFIRRANQLGQFNIIGDPRISLRMDSGDDGFGELKIGYYNARTVNSLDPAQQGDFENFAVCPLPIAVFNQGNNKFVQQATSHEPLPLIFYAGTMTGWANNAIAGAQLETIKRTYNFVGSFTYGNQTVDGIIMPGTAFEERFFPDRNALRVTELEDKDVTFRIPNNIENTHAYYFFRGEEAEFTVTVYPADGN